MEIRCGERTPVLTHHGIGRRHGKRRKRLDNPESHRVHYVRQTAHNLAERAELTGENGID